MKKIVLLIAAILLVITSCKPQTEGIKDVTVDDLKVVLNSTKTIQLLDVRTPSEWEKGSINNAIKINVTSNKFETLVLEKLNKEVPVYVYCRSGGRSKIASEILLKNGFEAYNVLGGYLDWQKKNN
ncbi:MAG: rhodanese-like domain-containing protein [Tenacibaculum sp.]